MNGKALYQPVRLTQGLLENVKYPLDIWFNVFQHLGLLDYKAFFETCWAFKSFCTWELINKVAHKGNSLFAMFREELPFHVWEYMTIDLLVSNLKGLDGLITLVESVEASDAIPFSKIKDAYHDELKRLMSIPNGTINTILRTFKLTIDDAEYLRSLASEPQLALMVTMYWVLNPNIEWDELEYIAELEGNDSPLINNRMKNVPLGILLKRANATDGQGDLSFNPNISIRYMLDDPDCKWEWEAALSKPGWTTELVDEFLKLDSINDNYSRVTHKEACDRLKRVCFNDGPLYQDHIEYPYLEDPPLHSSLYGYIPKGFVEAYVTASSFMESSLCWAHLHNYNLISIIKAKPFDKDELRDLVLCLSNISHNVLAWGLPHIVVNPSFDQEALNELKVYSPEAYGLLKDRLYLLLSNPSFGFLDIAQELNLVKRVIG